MYGPVSVKLVTQPCHLPHGGFFKDKTHLNRTKIPQIQICIHCWEKKKKGIHQIFRVTHVPLMATQLLKQTKYTVRGWPKFKLNFVSVSVLTCLGKIPACFVHFHRGQDRERTKTGIFLPFRNRNCENRRPLMCTSDINSKNLKLKEKELIKRNINGGREKCMICFLFWDNNHFLVQKGIGSLWTAASLLVLTWK